MECGAVIAGFPHAGSPRSTGKALWAKSGSLNSHVSSQYKPKSPVA